MKTIVDVLTSYTSAFNFGTIGNFPTFLKTYQNRVPCNTCLSSLNNKKLANTNYDDFDKLIKNTTYGYYNFHSTIPGFSSFYAREPFSIGNPNSRSGGQHMLKYLANKGYTATSIADVDTKFGGTNPYANKAYDVRLNTPNAENVVFIEFKSIKRKGNADTETAPVQKVDNETDEYVYFTGSYNQRLQPHLVGVFNRKTFSVDWIHDVDLTTDPKMGYPPSLNQAPQVDGNKLYVLDTGGTLHIFEKTEEN